MATQTGSAYFPRIFKPDAKEVMVIGFGSGCTPGRSLIFPDTHVTCCELEPAVYAASEHFGLVNGRPHRETRAWLEAENAKLPESQRLSADEIAAKARLSMIFGDGRTAVQGSTKKYDLVISEPSNPWIAGCSNLFTREFFRSTREHLTEGGVLAQWIQAYSFTVDDYAMIVRTMRTEFPHFGVVLLAGGVDTLLLASDKPLVPDAAQLALMQKHVDESPVVKADLETWFGGSDLRWLLVANYLLGEKQLNALVDRDPAQAGVINTDLHLRLEFDAPLHLFRALKPEETASIALPKAVGNWPSELAASLGLQANTPEFFTTLGDYSLRQAENFTSATRANSPIYLGKAQHFYGEALKLDPKHEPALTGQRRVKLRQDRETDPEKVLRELIEIAPDDAVARYQLAEVMLRGKRKAEAIGMMREALERAQPLSFDKRTFVWANDLAWMLATSPEAELRNPEEAVRWAQAACEVSEYSNPAIMDTLSTALAAAGRFDEAIEMANRVIALAEDQPELVASTRQRIKLYQAKQPYIDQKAT
jgi:tetratricopeptide (TPR) repeat protein